MLSRLALVGIAGYQRHLSPRKGYASAYRILHGGTGGSGFAKAAIAEQGLFAAISQIRARFAACRDAAKALHEDPERRDKWFNNFCVECGCGACDPVGGCQNAAPDCDCAPDCRSL